jgi:two-component sensor histidine kinase
VVTNALKHAFQASGRGTITIRLETLEGGQAALSIADDGPGIPAGFDPAASRSLGFRIVQGLAAQLDGTLTYANEGGTVVRLVFAAGPAPAAA